MQNKKGVILLILLTISIFLILMILNNNNELIENATTIEKEEITLDNNKREKVISLSSYNVYFYDIEDVYFNYKGKSIQLKKALLAEQISIEQVIQQAEEDTKGNFLRKAKLLDGGSTKYYYNDFSIIKFHSLDGNRDVYIGRTDMDINVLKQGY